MSVDFSDVEHNTAAKWVLEFSKYESGGSWKMTVYLTGSGKRLQNWQRRHCQLPASVWLVCVLVSHNQITVQRTGYSRLHAFSLFDLRSLQICMIACVNYTDFRRSFRVQWSSMWPRRRPYFIIKLTGYSVTHKNTECCGLTGSKCLNTVFSTTHFIFPHFAQVYLKNRTSYRSTIKCVVKRKKSAFRSYAKLKIKISQLLSHFVSILLNVLKLQQREKKN